ncbi:DUF560 domain-containing protein [Moraxella catarrhalis]|uniref:surface lipoprotein assembly modifier n=1 Tax=Moraxella catarrhalis TaxID=480 RepID=UPI000EAA2F9B|nr:surface lipoprotein assembly modifier [Moraxella catarrhalis]RKM09185.1 DUF560 domain-containing protein [Moraxella catarrhalis]RKM10680.1 DUF560 domain-containing protein [Moraxella catarrhalis]
MYKLNRLKYSLYISNGFFVISVKVNEKKLYIACCIALSAPAIAQESPPSQTVFFEKTPQIQPELLLNQPSINTPSAAPLPEGSSLEESINFAIITKDWQKLEKLLAQYRTTTNFDSILYNYGLGALYRHQGRQKEAIALYQQILKDQQDLHYSRFDLAMMLYEDKRYAEAKVQLEAAEPYLAPELQRLVSQILGNIKKSQKWQPTLNFSYESTDNVNQASNLKELVIGEATFIRSNDSLPQDAHGISYNIGAAQEQNIKGNHYIYKDLNLGGVNYWDNNDYNELTLQANLGYRYKDIKQSWGLITTAEQNLLGGSRYNQNYAATLEYSRKISNQWQISGSLAHLQKRYEDEDSAIYYNGNANSTAWILLYQPKPKWLVYGGADFMRDNLADPSESSDRQGIRGGMAFSGEKINLRSSIRYAQRDFKGNNFFYGKKRKDDEYQFNANLGNKKFNWQGFTPKLDYVYKKIDSNLPLYKRSNSAIYLRTDKHF